MSNTGLSQRTIVDIVSLCVHLSRKSYGHQFPLLAGSSKLLNAFPWRVHSRRVHLTSTIGDKQPWGVLGHWRKKIIFWFLLCTKKRFKITPSPLDCRKRHSKPDNLQLLDWTFSLLISKIFAKEVGSAVPFCWCTQMCRSELWPHFQVSRGGSWFIFSANAGCAHPFLRVESTAPPACASVWPDQLGPSRAKLAMSKSISRRHKTSSFWAHCRCFVPRRLLGNTDKKHAWVTRYNCYSPSSSSPCCTDVVLATGLCSPHRS